MKKKKKWIAGIAVIACAAAVICGIVLNKTGSAEVKPAEAAVAVEPQRKFTGWNTKADGSGKMFQGGQDIGKLVKENPEVSEYLDADGNLDLYAQWEIVKGWQTIDGKKYYVNDDDKFATGWQHIDNRWYWFASDGPMTIGWLKLGDIWYYLGSDGIMQTGWQDIGGSRYYFYSGGNMATGLTTVGSKKYYFASGGQMVTGWQQIDNKWYYFNASPDGSMKTGWYKEGNYWYYLTTASDHTSWGDNYPEGSMLANTYMDQNGKRYTFDASGHCNNP